MIIDLAPVKTVKITTIWITLTIIVIGIVNCHLMLFPMLFMKGAVSRIVIFALVSFWRFRNPMKVVAQQTPSMNLPPSLLTIFSQRFHEPNMILFIFKNVLSAIPTIHWDVQSDCRRAFLRLRSVHSREAALALNLMARQVHWLGCTVLE